MPNPVLPVALDSLVVDCTPLASFIVDLARGARRGMQVEQEGFSEVIAEILTNQQKYGDKAGITATDFQAFKDANDHVAAIDIHLPALRKLVELLEETRANEDDKRQRQASGFAVSLERRFATTKDAEMLAKYERTRTYRSAIAVKGAKTRAKNAKPAEPKTP